MTYISPKPVAMQGLRTWATSNNVAPSRNGTGTRKEDSVSTNLPVLKEEEL